MATKWLPKHARERYAREAIEFNQGAARTYELILMGLVWFDGKLGDWIGIAGDGKEVGFGVFPYGYLAACPNPEQW